MDRLPPSSAPDNDDNSSADILEEVEVSLEVRECNRAMRVVQAAEDYHEATATPEHRLVGAVLERAFLDLSRPERPLRRSAIRWIFSEDIDEFSFLGALEVLNLGISAAQLRAFATRILKQHEH